MRAKVVYMKHLSQDLLYEFLKKDGITKRELVEGKVVMEDHKFESEEEYLKWKAWCVEKIMKRLRIPHGEAELEFERFDLALGPSWKFS